MPDESASQDDQSATRGPSIRAIFLAYHFPPLGGAGVQRTAKFVRYLPDHDIHPVVVTGPLERATAWPPADETLVAEIPDEVPVFRVGRQLGLRDPKGTARTAALKVTLRRLFRVPNAFSRGWVEGCLEMGGKAVAETGPSLIFATMSPFETAEAAAELSRRTGLPWVADLRDPWALDEMMVYPSRWHRALERRRMHRALSSAAMIVMNTPEASLAVGRRFPDLAERVVTITNGYDAVDFAHPPAGEGTGKLRIVHTGGLHTRLGFLHRRHRWLRRLLGSLRGDVDILPRSHYFLVQALARLRARDPSVADQIELVLAGSTNPTDHRVVEDAGLGDMVRFEGYVDHGRSVALLQSADLLFLPLHDVAPGERTRIVPGKLYEYLAARRPILAAVPDGDARDFVEASGRGLVCAPTDVDGLCDTLDRWRQQHARDEDAPGDGEFHLRFERRVLTATLARTLRRATTR